MSISLQRQEMIWRGKYVIPSMEWQVCQYHMHNYNSYVYYTVHDQSNRISLPEYRI